MAADSNDNSVNAELELLRSMYDESELSFPPSESLPSAIKFYARPYVAANESHVFCSIDAELLIPSSYPVHPITVIFSHYRGFDDAELYTLKTDLVKFSEEQSSLAAVHIFEILNIIREKVSDLNQPNPCPICFEKVLIAAQVGNACVRLDPCWHAMHAHCFREYLQHKASARNGKEVHLRSTLGRIGAREKAFENWIACPICFTSIDIHSANKAASEFMNVEPKPIATLHTPQV